MKSTFTLLTFCILTICLTLALLEIRTYSIINHEETHKVIFEMFDISSNITYNYLFFGIIENGATKTKDYYKCEEVCKSLQAQNEIMYYNVELIYYVAFALMEFYLITKMLFIPLVEGKFDER